jgi:hypothetical protein
MGFYTPPNQERILHAVVAILLGGYLIGLLLRMLVLIIADIL